MADESNKDKKKKIKGFKEFDPGNYIDIEPTINEAKVGEVVVSWGRMNPITTGHEKLINRVLNVAKSKNATPAVFLTHSQDKTKNPLSYNDKIKYAEVAFGKIIKRSTAKTIIQLMQQLQKKFKKVTLVVGSDRYKEMDTLLNKYNGKEYKFDEIEVVSAGARDPDAEGVKGMSASKMREYAVSDNIKKFTTGLPSKLKTNAADIMASIKKGMRMSEEYNEDNFIEEDELDEALTRQQRIKRGRQMRRMRVKMKRGREKAARRRANIDVLKSRSRKAARNIIKTRLAGNKRYADMEPAEKERIDKRIEKISKQRIDNLAIKLLPSVKKKERERLQARHNKNESVDLNEMWGAYVTKRPHMLMDKNNKPKFDKRFKMFKPKQVTEMNEFDIEDIVELMESVEKFTETTGKYYTGVAKNKKEEVEQMDEISKELAQRYYSKSYDAQRKAMNTMIDTEKARKPEKKKAYDDARATFRKRGKGTDMAAKRLAYKGKNEEVELDESRAEAMTYHKKMSSYHDNMHKELKADGMNKEALQHAKARNLHFQAEKQHKDFHKDSKKATKRANDHTDAANQSSKGYERNGKKYDHMSSKRFHESVEHLDEAATPQMKKAAASIEAYAKKSGGIDKADFMKAAKMLSSGNAGSNFIKFVDDLDTEPREWLITNLAKTMGKQTVEKMFKVKIREEVTPDPIVVEATAMTAGPKGSLGGIGKKPSMPAPGDSKRTINAPSRGTARYHADMAAKHQQFAQHHGSMAAEHEDEGNDDKADHHYDKMQHHDNAADAHEHAQDMIKKHGSDHPEAQKASKEANKHKLGESVEHAMSNQLDELTAAEKKLVNQMYDKKGNLTPLGKKVMNHGKKPGDKGFVESLDDKFEAFMAESIDEVLDEDAKMKKQSDDNLKSLHKQFKGQDQKMPSTQHMMKRITKEMKRRNMSESEEAAKLASVANGGVQDKEDKFKNALNRIRNKKSMKDESSCGSSKKRNEEAGAGEEGTAKLLKRLKKDTPNA